MVSFLRFAGIDGLDTACCAVLELISGGRTAEGGLWTRTQSSPLFSIVRRMTCFYGSPAVKLTYITTATLTCSRVVACHLLYLHVPVKMDDCDTVECLLKAVTALA